MNVPIKWPEGKRFAFTVFDDPDGDTVSARKFVYPLLADLGLRTTIAVWPLGPMRERNSSGETCTELEYRQHLQRMQSLGFEIAYHNAAPHNCTRDEITESLEAFREYFGAYPASAANHYNADALYWGAARLHSPLRRGLYHVLTRGQSWGRFEGHVEGSPHFWGDLCQQHIRYYRNLVFRDINTLTDCPWQPYHDPARPFVREWFTSSEGTDCDSFLERVADANQERLEQEGGMCIMYTHFGKGYVKDGRLNPEFERAMTRMSKRNGWFVPVTTLLDYLRTQNGHQVITPANLARMEWKWLLMKVFHGTS